ncbi:hypothetical protein HMI49_11025 [Corallococcus exercitus]|uniref:Uncharacterized protein n=1 Tax=Corallococcus exercitus TaxID=2316736 RepID=A0A7Y4KH55_9BACT|nr:hypothetical protein [Corallococcus exercitus]NOK33730.1 hypothetical protein [Corallococcus exercitus]
MISSVSSRSNPSSFLTSLQSSTRPQPAQQAQTQPSQDTSAAALRNKLFYADSFESSPSARTQSQSLSATPTTRPAGAGSDPLGADALVKASSHDASRDYPALSYADDKQYNGQPLGFWKKNVWDSAIKSGAAPEEAALLVAQVMQEGGTDFNKSGAATNYGPFNLNKDLLETYGKHLPDDLQMLNGSSPEAIDLNVSNALDAMRAVGANNYLHHVRGGRTNFEHPQQRISNNPNVKGDDAFAFERSLTNNARLFLEAAQANPSALTDNQRFASDIPNI